MLSLPRAILFDLDNTIITSGGRPEAAWLAVLRHYEAAIAPLAPEQLAAAIQRAGRGFFDDPAQYRLWRFRLDEARHEMVRRAFAIFAESQGVVLPAALAVEIGDRHRVERDAQLRVFPGARETLHRLAALGVRMALITNGAADIQREKIVRFELAAHFEHIQIEGEHGFGKPDERAYTHAMTTLAVGPSECWMVGDNLEWEVAAPQRLGIHAVWHDVHGAGLPAGSAIRPDRIIRALPELLEEGSLSPPA